MLETDELVLLKFSTAYHLLNGLAYIEWLSKNTSSVNFVVCYEDYWKKNNLDQFYLRFLADSGAELVDVDSFIRIESELKTKKKNILS